MHVKIRVTVHTLLFREVFWHAYAKIPRHTAQIYAKRINPVHRETCYRERNEQTEAKYNKTHPKSGLPFRMCPYISINLNSDY